MSENYLKNSIGIRLLIIVFLTIFLLICSLLIMSLIKEREARSEEASLEICSKWANQQIVAGPILTVPYQYSIINDEGKLLTYVKYAHFLPDRLSISCELFPQIRYRGIYQVVLYRAEINLKGNYSSPDFTDLDIESASIIWKDAFLSIGISDMKGINDNIELQWNKDTLIASPGAYLYDAITSGINVKIPLHQGESQYEFSARIDLNGSKNIMFLPVGKTTDVRVLSTWENPSFTGNYLPDKRRINSDGFEADWKIIHLNRNYPQKWIDDQYHISDSAFGVELLLPVDQYQKTMRTVKYAIMFISLTFLSFFMIELLSKNIIHPVQYTLIGFALLIFYSLLLSLSEHINFTSAYFIASCAIVAMITSYTRSVITNLRQTAMVAVILIILYSYLYVVLQLQDYALLIGNIGLFIALTIVMYLTRKIDWFSILHYKKDKD
jgi:inner membrane protein